MGLFYQYTRSAYSCHITWAHPTSMQGRPTPTTLTWAYPTSMQGRPTPTTLTWAYPKSKHIKLSRKSAIIFNNEWSASVMFVPPPTRKTKTFFFLKEKTCECIANRDAINGHMRQGSALKTGRSSVANMWRSLAPEHASYMHATEGMRACNIATSIIEWFMTKINDCDNVENIEYATKLEINC